MKPARAETVSRKNLISKDPIIKEKRKKKKVVEEVVMVPVEKTQIVEETVVVQKEVPVTEYE